MNPTIQPRLMEPYLFFDGRCDEAIELYSRVLGARVNALMRFRESPDPQACAPGMEDKVMHASLQVGETSLLVSDGRCGGKPVFAGFALCVSLKDAAEAERVFSDLSQGGEVQMPITETFFSPRFGMVADRFGVSWMVLVMP